MKRALVLASVLAAQPALADESQAPPVVEAAQPLPAVREMPVEPTPVEPKADAPAPKAQPVVGKTDEPTALDAESAPLPGEESGRTDRESGDSTLRNIGQGLLFIPRIAVETAFAPIRAGAYVYDRYSLTDRFSSTFFDSTNTWGLYPTASVDSTYGVNVGARLLHRSLFGAHEKFSLRGTTGGQFRTLVDGSLRSGTRLGKNVSLQLRAEYERRPRDPFYGIGNLNTERDVRFREEVKRATSYLDIKATDWLVLRSTGAVTDRMYAPSSEGTPIDAMYDTSMLTGFSGISNLYGELELRFDTRARQETPGRHQIYDTGTLFSVFTGRVHQLEAGNDYTRYGGQAQRFFGLGATRALMTRAYVEGVTGDYTDVAFNQLPELGGSALLRGYSSGRFRDRAAVVGTVEYFWGLGQLFMASLFVDGGRVYPSFADLQAEDMRLGFGGSLQLHGHHTFISGLTVASSIDGGLFINLSFDPVFDYDARGER